MPVMGSRRDLKCAIVHDGFTLLSDDALDDLMRRGMSAALPLKLWKFDMLGSHFTEVDVKLETNLGIVCYDVVDLLLLLKTRMESWRSTTLVGR